MRRSFKASRSVGFCLAERLYTYYTEPHPTRGPRKSQSPDSLLLNLKNNTFPAAEDESAVPIERAAVGVKRDAADRVDLVDMGKWRKMRPTYKPRLAALATFSASASRTSSGAYFRTTTAPASTISRLIDLPSRKITPASRPYDRVEVVACAVYNFGSTPTTSTSFRSRRPGRSKQPPGQAASGNSLIGGLASRARPARRNAVEPTNTGISGTLKPSPCGSGEVMVRGSTFHHGRAIIGLRLVGRCVNRRIMSWKTPPQGAPATTAAGGGAGRLLQGHRCPRGALREDSQTQV